MTYISFSVSKKSVQRRIRACHFAVIFMRASVRALDDCFQCIMHCRTGRGLRTPLHDAVL